MMPVTQVPEYINPGTRCRDPTNMAAKDNNLQHNAQYRLPKSNHTPVSKFTHNQYKHI